MPGPQYSSNAQGLNPFDVDAVTITRNPGGVNPPVTTVWTGTADLQEDTGQMYYDPEGAVEEIDATLIIDTTPLPSVLVGDIVAAPDGRTFAVVAVINSTYALLFIKLLLKRGPIRYEQK